MRFRFLWLGALGGIAAGLLIAGPVIWYANRMAEVEMPDPASVGGPFTLTDQTGKPRTWDSFRGKAVAVFFGFTHCPDVCPTTLYELSERLKGLGPDGDKLQVVLISVDPTRDTPEKLASYIQSFDKRIVALTGTEEQVDGTVKAFRAYRKKVPTEGGDYTMDHTAVVYLFDNEGRFLSTLDRHEPAETQVEKLKRIASR